MGIVTAERMEAAKAHMAKVSEARLLRPLVIDLENLDAYESAIRWALRCDEFKGDLNKGLMIRGVPGSGKTHLMRLLSLCLKTKHPFPIVACQKMVSLYIEGGDAALSKWNTIGIVGFDDLGDEESAKRYGNDNEVMVRMHERRYDYSLTHPMVTLCTTNLGSKGLETRYGPRCLDRMQQMYNVIVLNRDVSFRKSTSLAPWNLDQLKQ